MTRFIILGILALFCLSGNVWAEEAKDVECVSVERGDTLSSIAKKLQTTVADLAEKNGIKNPNRIHPGQTICRSGNEKASNPKQPKPKSQEVQGRGVANSGNYTPYRDIGANPLVMERDRDPKNLMFSERDALVLLGVTGDDFFKVVSLVTSGQGKPILLKRGDKFPLMTEGAPSTLLGKSVRVSQNRIADWDGEKSAVRFDLADGRAIVRIDQCYNWAILEQPIPSTLETPVRKPAEDIAMAALDDPKPKEAPEETNVCGLDDHELFVSRGGSIGNGAHTTYGYADGFACLQKTHVEGGVVKAGLEGVGGNWHGSADDGFGYGGKRYGFGPAVGYVDDNGWDARFGLIFGRFLNSGHSLDEFYRQTRNFNMTGPTLGVNLYQREIDGEKFFPKTQIWASAFKLYAAHMAHSWQGNVIPDTKDLKSSWIVSLGVRQFLYQGPIKPWLSGEFFGELPMTKDGTLMVGITDENEMVWIGIGKTWDLKKGGSAKSWMVGVDVGNVARTIRGDTRNEEWEKAGSSRYNPETGIFESGNGSSVARFDIATGQFVPSSEPGSSMPVSKGIDENSKGKPSEFVELNGNDGGLATTRDAKGGQSVPPVVRFDIATGQFVPSSEPGSSMMVARVIGSKSGGNSSQFTGLNVDKDSKGVAEAVFQPKPETSFESGWNGK